MFNKDNKVSFQNLALIITNKCNLDCAHCCRGCKNNKDMSKEVIEKVLSQVAITSNLAICGGEITLALPTLEYIINYIIENHVLLEQLTLTINGTNYSEELLRLLDEINEYINSYMHLDESRANFTISSDRFHTEEMERLGIFGKYLENCMRYSESIHFYGIQILKPHKKLFREGNACFLDKKITVELRPTNTMVTYVSNSKKFDRENGLCNIGPIVTINTDGIITEADSSLENQQTIYNYGSVFDSSLENQILKRAKVLKPNAWYRACTRETKRYHNYNR